MEERRKGRLSSEGRLKNAGRPVFTFLNLFSVVVTNVFSDEKKWGVSGSPSYASAKMRLFLPCFLALIHSFTVHVFRDVLLKGIFRLLSFFCHGFYYLSRLICREVRSLTKSRFLCLFTSNFFHNNGLLMLEMMLMLYVYVNVLHNHINRRTLRHVMLFIQLFRRWAWAYPAPRQA